MCSVTVFGNSLLVSAEASYFALAETAVLGPSISFAFYK